MKRALTVILLLGSSSFIAACNEQPAAPAPTEAEKMAEAPAPVRIADEDIAVTADFEEQAATSITSANYKAEIDTIESEMSL